MTDTHHNAAQADERRGRKTELLRAQQSSNHHVAPGLELAIGFDRDAASQIVEHQRLVCFRETQFPRHARMLDAGQRGSASAAIVSADQHDICSRFDHSGCDRADADFGNQLHADARPRVRALQIVDQFGQVLDRVDVMMRWRGNETNARSRVPHFCDVRINFISR